MFLLEAGKLGWYCGEVEHKNCFQFSKSLKSATKFSSFEDCYLIVRDMPKKTLSEEEITVVEYDEKGIALAGWQFVKGKWYGIR